MNHHARFGAMIALSFQAMYALMYSMVTTWRDVLYPSLGQSYMAGLMTAPMVLLSQPLEPRPHV